MTAILKQWQTVHCFSSTSAIGVNMVLHYNSSREKDTKYYLDRDASTVPETPQQRRYNSATIS